MTIVLIAATGVASATAALAQGEPYVTTRKPATEQILGGTNANSTSFAARRVFETAPSAVDVDDLIRDEVLSKLDTVGAQPGGAPAAFAPPAFALTAVSEPRQIGRNWVATYGLSYRSVDLAETSDISSIYSPESGRTKIRGRNLPSAFNFDFSGGTPSPDIEREEALRVALARLVELGVERATPGNATILADRMEIWVDPEDLLGHLSWSLDIDVSSAEGVADSGSVYRVWVDAKRAPEVASVLEVKELVQREQYGVVLARVWNETPLDGSRLLPLAHARVERRASDPVMAEGPEENGATSGAPGLPFPLAEDVVFADEHGVFRFEQPVTPARLSISLRNGHFAVTNAAGETVILTVDEEGASGLLLPLAGQDEFDIAQHSAFYWANAARAFVADALKENEPGPIMLTVNQQHDCNASWSSIKRIIELRRSSPPDSGKTCVNRAYRDTIFHEFGHALDHLFGTILDHAYSEGFADTLAILMKDSSCYGQNAITPGHCLRDAASPVVRYAPSSLDSWTLGRSYSGFNWALVQELAQTYTRGQSVDIARRWLLEVAVANPTSIENAVALTFDVDDDDLDLSNGTPHAVQIIAAARSRGIPIPEDLPF